MFFSLLSVEIAMAFGQRGKMTFATTLDLFDRLFQKKGGILFWMSLECQLADFSYG
jgi:hypothetical protein